MQTGIEAFVQHITQLGLEVTVEADLVLYRVVAVDGAYAGEPIETGVAISELQMWPQAPPHWVHFPNGVKFSSTNSRASPKPDWLMHSRRITGWGDAPPGVAWTSHVRAVLSETVA